MRRYVWISLLAAIAVIAGLVAPLVTPQGASAQGDGFNCNGLSEADCQILLDARAAMQDVGAFTMPEWQIEADVNVEGEGLTFAANGSGVVVLPELMDELLAGIDTDALMDDPQAIMPLFERLDAATVEELLAQTGLELVVDLAVLSVPDDTLSGSATAVVRDSGLFLLVDTPEDGPQWFGERLELTAADRAELEALLDDLAMGPTDPEMDELFGMLPMASEAFAEIMVLGSEAVVTTRGDDMTLHGQEMATFETTLNLGTLLMDPRVGNLIVDLLGEEITQDDAVSLRFLLFTFGLLLEDAEFSMTQWVGRDDALIHRLGLTVDVALDTSLLDDMAPSGEPLTLMFDFFVEIDEHNAVTLDAIEAPDEYQPLDSLEDVFPELEDAEELLPEITL